MAPMVGRLRKRPEFLKVAAARAKWVTPGLVLQARRRPEAWSGGGSTAPGDADRVRVGFTVSRKVGNAVRRNRARRRLRAAAGEVLPYCGRPGHDYVLIGRVATLGRPYVALVEDLRDALRHLTQRGRRRQETPRAAPNKDR